MAGKNTIGWKLQAVRESRGYAWSNWPTAPT